MSAEAFEGKSRMMPPLPPVEATVAPPPLPPGAFAEEAGLCANCLSPLAGPFCAQCGQHIADYHRSVWRFVTDFFESAFSWDNKFLRTVDPLVRRPGWLTQEFMAGRRVRYVHPLRLFLFTSFVCLALLQWTHRDPATHVRRHRTEAKATAATTPAAAGDEDDEDETKIPAPTPAPSPATATTPTGSPTPAEQSLRQIFRDTYKHHGENGVPPDAAAKLAAAGDDLQKKMEAAAAKIETADKAASFSQRVTTNVQSKLSWVALAMLPIFALFMRLAFGRAGGYYFAHLVFSLHYHTFLLMFWVVYSWVSGLASLLQSDALRLVTGLALCVPPWYLFRALRQMYGQGWSVTAGKVFALGVVHLLTLFAGLGMIGATAFL